MGTLGDILQKSGACPFCRLIVKSVASNAEDAAVALVTLLDVKCSLNWEIDGRGKGRSDSVRPRTRRIHLQFSDESLGDSYLVYVAQARYVNNSDAKNAWRTRDLFLGRIIKPRSNNEVLIKSWLDACSSEHQGPCSHNDEETLDRFEDLIGKSYFGVVDVLDMCLTALPRHKDSYVGLGSESVKSSGSTLPQLVWSQYSKAEARHAPYVALSYVWGEGERFTTTSSNILRLREMGALESHLHQLPRVVDEAIKLTRRLGLRYIWVDSLCIIQDSVRSWKLNAQSMDLIYGSALLTICAADGNDADVGLKALNPAARIETQHMEDVAPGVRLMVTRLAETRIKHSKWNSRAWVFQERMLSKRCLIFTEGRVFFQCRSTTMSEEIVNEPEGSGWSLDLVHSPSQLLRDLATRSFWVYANCVSLYSSRQLTKSEDILAAFDGVANYLTNAMRAPFVFGLATSHFDLALLWEPLQPIQRRWTDDSSDMLEDKKRSNFPSWSWCGWSGATIEYKHDFLFENVHEWLCKHTWISWYIRDGHGDLRPLWNDEESMPSWSTEDRWRGYGTYGAQRPYQPHAGNSSESPSSRKSRGYYRQEVQIRERVPVVDQYPHQYGYAPSMQQQEMYPIPDQRSRVTQVSVHDHKAPSHFNQVYPPQDPYRGMYNSQALPPPPPPPPQQAPYMEPYGAAYWPEPNREREEEYYAADEARDVSRGPRDNYTTSSQHELLASGRDEYGRWLDPEIASRTRGTFSRTVPESPYRVNMAPYTNEPDKEFPDHPLLQFYTWSAEFHVLPQEDMSTIGGSRGLHRYDIADDAGDWCGTIVLDSRWVQNWQLRNRNRDFAGSRHEFLAISEAKYFTREECDTWTYYIPIERNQSEWDVYFVILVEKRNMISYRVGLGKIFKTAFFKGSSEGDWKEVVLG